MKICGQKIKKISKINLDLVMLILLISKNMELEIIEEEEDPPLEKQLQGLQLVLLQKKF